ncbi:MAG: hydroxyacid dehydrogenase [Pseudomonadota bacterium]|nr:hydroxyacid dehydrogenase [Pseudomonadota bacterium]
MPHVIIAGSIHASGLETLKRRSDFTFEYLVESTDNSYVKYLVKADALILRTQPLLRKDIETAVNLKIVSRHGVGYDAVDVDALSAQSIPLTIVGDVNSQSVAEHSITLLLAATKRLIKNDSAARSGSWDYKNKLEPEEISGKKLLILGFGRVGQRLAKIANAFSMQISIFDPFLDTNSISESSVYRVTDLDMALSAADYISINMPAPEKPILNAREFKLMRDGVVIVNTARGGIINENDMIKALESGKIGAAGLDVFNDEPPTSKSPFADFSQVVLTPHVAGLTREAAEGMAVSSVQNVIDYFDRNLDSKLIVNKESLRKNGHS